MLQTRNELPSIRGALEFLGDEEQNKPRGKYPNPKTGPVSKSKKSQGKSVPKSKTSPTTDVKSEVVASTDSPAAYEKFLAETVPSHPDAPKPATKLDEPAVPDSPDGEDKESVAEVPGVAQGEDEQSGAGVEMIPANELLPPVGSSLPPVQEETVEVRLSQLCPLCRNAVLAAVRKEVA
jgi:hypothetical protein